MCKLPEDHVVVDALTFKKDQFTSKFVASNNPKHWSSVDIMYFKHICTILNHAKYVFQADLESLIDKKIKIKDDI